jgi:HSP20 family molecular chaperone IbpA
VFFVGKCSRCGKGIEGNWAFCPHCGQRQDGFYSNFGSVFSRVFKEMEEMKKEMNKEFEAFDLSPFFKPLTREDMERMQGRPLKKGFSIRIFRSNQQQPKVVVKTFGDMDRDKIKQEIYGQMGGKKAGESRARVVFPGISPPSEGERQHKLHLKVPETTEEPKMQVRRTDSKVVVELDMPGVESMGMIDIRELESSIEVKAAAEKKAYFKILTKPAQYRLAGKRFENGRLFLEFY